MKTQKAGKHKRRKVRNLNNKIVNQISLAFARGKILGFLKFGIKK